MKIAFNSLPLKTGHQTRGIGSYTKNLINALKDIPDIYIQEFSELSQIKDAEIVHYPFFDLFQTTLPIRKKFSTVVTIHDVIPLIFPKNYPIGPKGILANVIQKFSLKGARAVITDSQASKKDIAKYLGVPLKNIFPIYLAPASHFIHVENREIKNTISKKYNLPEKFVLYAGNVNWNKNLVNMTKACKEADMDLVLVGKGFEQRENLDHPELKSYKQFLYEFGNDQKIHILGFVPDDDLVILYNLAVLTLFTSFYEGFGLPILESQACGTPVITSNNSSMAEVAGESALQVDPHNTEEITKAINNLMKNEGMRKHLINKGLENVKKFSWEKVAKETVKVYEKILT